MQLCLKISQSYIAKSPDGDHSGSQVNHHPSRKFTFSGLFPVSPAELVSSSLQHPLNSSNENYSFHPEHLSTFITQFQISASHYSSNHLIILQDIISTNFNTASALMSAFAVEEGRFLNYMKTNFEFIAKFFDEKPFNPDEKVKCNFGGYMVEDYPHVIAKFGIPFESVFLKGLLSKSIIIRDGAYYFDVDPGYYRKLAEEIRGYSEISDYCHDHSNRNNSTGFSISSVQHQVPTEDSNPFEIFCDSTAFAYTDDSPGNFQFSNLLTNRTARLIVKGFETRKLGSPSFWTIEEQIFSKPRTMKVSFIVDVMGVLTDAYSLDHAMIIFFGTDGSCVGFTFDHSVLENYDVRQQQNHDFTIEHGEVFYIHPGGSDIEFFDKHYSSWTLSLLHEQRRIQLGNDFFIERKGFSYFSDHQNEHFHHSPTCKIDRKHPVKIKGFSVFEMTLWNKNSNVPAPNPYCYTHLDEMHIFNKTGIIRIHDAIGNLSDGQLKESFLQRYQNLLTMSSSGINLVFSFLVRMRSVYPFTISKEVYMSHYGNITDSALQFCKKYYFRDRLMKYYSDYEFVLSREHMLDIIDGDEIEIDPQVKDLVLSHPEWSAHFILSGMDLNAAKLIDELGLTEKFSIFKESFAKYVNAHRSQLIEGFKAFSAKIAVLPVFLYLKKKMFRYFGLGNCGVEVEVPENFTEEDENHLELFLTQCYYS